MKCLAKPWQVHGTHGTKLPRNTVAELKAVRARAVALVHARISLSLCHLSAESCLQDGKMQAKGMEAGRSTALCNVEIFRCKM